MDRGNAWLWHIQLHTVTRFVCFLKKKLIERNVISHLSIVLYFKGRVEGSWHIWNSQPSYSFFTIFLMEIVRSCLAMNKLTSCSKNHKGLLTHHTSHFNRSQHPLIISTAFDGHDILLWCLGNISLISCLLGCLNFLLYLTCFYFF